MISLDRDGNERHDKEVLDCTERLLKELIPNFAKSLNNSQFRGELRVLNGLKLTQLMHREGINMRHVCSNFLLNFLVHKYLLCFLQLGRLRSLVSQPCMKRLLLNEMVSRAVKCTLNQLMRKEMELIRVPAEVIYSLTCKFFIFHFLLFFLCFRNHIEDS